VVGRDEQGSVTPFCAAHCGDEQAVVMPGSAGRQVATRWSGGFSRGEIQAVMSPFPRRATPNSEAHRYYAEGHLQDESRVALSSPASLLSRSITPFALFGRRFTISGGGMLVPVRALGLRHLADTSPPEASCSR
jgi:hypothetical protein